MPHGVPTSDDEVVLGVHVVDSGCMGIPDLNNLEIEGVDDMDGTGRSCGAYISASSHNCILVLRRYLAS